MGMKRGYIAITDEIIEEIQCAIDRTGLSPQAVLKGKRVEREAGLTSSIIYGWIRRTSKTGKKLHVELTLSLWSELKDNPDKQKRNKNYRKGLAAIEEEDLEKLKYIRDHTGLLPSRIFRHCDDVPMYPNENIVSQWMSVPGYQARPDDIAWVLQSCEELLKRTLERINHPII